MLKFRNKYYRKFLWRKIRKSRYGFYIISDKRVVTQGEKIWIMFTKNIMGDPREMASVLRNIHSKFHPLIVHNIHRRKPVHVRRWQSVTCRLRKRAVRTFGYSSILTNPTQFRKNIDFSVINLFVYSVYHKYMTYLFKLDFNVKL